MQEAGVEIISKPKISFLFGVKRYAQLRKDVSLAGILDRSYGYYSLLTIITISGFFLSSACLFLFSSTAVLVFSMAAFIFFTIQVAGLVHDAGHKAIFKSSLINDIYGTFMAIMLNFCFSYWKFKHNKHHAKPNEIGVDPDIDIPLLTFSKNKKHSNTLTKFLVKYQAYIYYPLGSLVSFYERYKGLEYMKNKNDFKTFFELSLFFLSTFLWFVVPFLLASPPKAITLITIANIGSGLYLSNIFAPNHKGMPQYKKGTKVSFLEQQILTARNIKGNWFLDYLYIGLNYQTEHHLFTNCPRNNLSLITPFLKKVCKDTKLGLTQTGVLESNRLILSNLNEVAVAS